MNGTKYDAEKRIIYVHIPQSLKGLWFFCFDKFWYTFVFFYNFLLSNFLHDDRQTSSFPVPFPAGFLIF